MYSNTALADARLIVWYYGDRAWQQEIGKRRIGNFSYGHGRVFIPANLPQKDFLTALCVIIGYVFIVHGYVKIRRAKAVLG
ncbi:MAG TPA: hypothetical protein P5080_03020 [Candidatus Paceibacterota bacterium]|nr:hypothetical protein [Candidatus Pacearchaeota archaeon]HRZ50940.1 hypothetical protein [Candidatus Paceibacterota bacterium]HSA36661.1 hypothetical protein [Candidatus Paceibacterota bacterium]